MLVVGITGRSGSGKSTVAEHYKMLGYPVMDGDKISRDVTGIGSECLALLVEEFSDDILAEDGSLLRKKLAEKAFATPEKNARLLAITHPFILQEFLQRVRKAEKEGARLCFIDGAMIIGSLFEEQCDKIIVVSAEQAQEVARIMARDGITAEHAKARLSAQLSQKEMEAAASYCIKNNGTKAELTRKADVVLGQLLQEI